MPTDHRSLLNGAATAGAAPIVGFRPDGAVAAEDAGEDDVEPGGRYPGRLLPPDGRAQGAHRIEGRRDHRLASKPILQPPGSIRPRSKGSPIRITPCPPSPPG